MARTDTEIYRRFDGELKALPLRWHALGAAGVRVALKRKLPLLLLLVPPGIATIVAAFLVHAKFTLQQGESSPNVLDPGVLIAQAIVQQLFEVRQQITQFVMQMQFFALLAMGWYGAGQIAEDRRQGAHLLYFARPMTRLDYFLGKLLTTSTFGFFTIVLPCAIICLVAAFSSPEWSFVKQEGDVIVKTLVFAVMWVLAIAVLVLAASSLVLRRTYALALIFGFTMINQALAGLMEELFDNRDLLAIGLLNDLLRIGGWMLGKGPLPEFDVRLAFGVVFGVTAVALLILWRRITRLEVVA
jgi:ABC-type transport system involved in multi-copper enzyme maturation permease subunit